MNTSYLRCLPAAFLFLACHHAEQPPKQDFLTDGIDTTVSPAQDFFMFTNGTWVKNTPIPAAESYWGLGNLVQEDIYHRLKKINEDAQEAKAAEGTITQKIGDFWYSSMDTVALEKNGLTPLKPVLTMIDSIQTSDDIARAAAALHTIGIDVLFQDYVGQDDKNSDKMAYQLGQGGLGMPNRDYYFNTDERTVGVRKAYNTYLFQTFKQLGSDSGAATRKAAAVMQLETGLAKASRKLADLRDPYKNYNKMGLLGLEKVAPNFNWAAYVSGSGITHLDTVIVGQPEFYTALSQEIKNTSIRDWKDYLNFHVVSGSAGYLDSETFNNSLAYHKSLSGVLVAKARWKRSLDAEEEAMGEALGQLFVKEYFSEQAKQRYSDLIENIRAAFKDRIRDLTWMSDSTKERAYHKLAMMTKKVGYPDKWKDFSALKIDRGPYVLNMQRAMQWWHNYSIAKLGKPVDRTEWGMTPQTYNAYYNPSNNEIVMSAAGFIIPGTRDEDLDEAFVYGYAGANWIGHEMTHGFDDQGRLYDEHGNLKNWWQKSDSIQFAQRARKIVQQFDEFNPVDTLHINGSATQGENIADLGGLLLGLDAFKKTAAYQKGDRIGGFTPTQRFFLGYSYGWRAKERKEALARQVMTDVHSPAEFRVNGPMADIPAFYEAFGVKPGDKMYRADSLRVSIW